MEITGQDRQFFHLMGRAVREGWDLSSEARHETTKHMLKVLRADNVSDREKTRAAAVLATLDRSFIGMLETGAKIEAGGEAQSQSLNVTINGAADTIEPRVSLSDPSNMEAIDELRRRLSELGGDDGNGG